MSEIATLVILADGRAIFSGPVIDEKTAHDIATSVKDWLLSPNAVLVLRAPTNVIDLRKHP